MILNELFLYIPTCVNYDHAKFSDDPSTLAEEDACRVEQNSTKKY